MRAERYAKLKDTEAGRLLLRQKRAERYEREKGAGTKLKGDPKPAAFVALDGEGVTLPSGDHVYVLLGSSQSERCPDLENPAGLGTEEVLKYLLELGRGNRRLVGFALNYDVNCWLKDVPEKSLDILWRSHSCYFQGATVGASRPRYRLQWYPGHSFTVSKMEWQDGEWKSVIRATCWDTFGFFQSAFLFALKEWSVGTKDELRIIEKMKAVRSAFVAITPELREYNRIECVLLADLIERLRVTLEAAGIQITRWDGAGAIASAMLRERHVEQTLDDNGLPRQMVMEAYFGGRSQATAIGRFENVLHYDLNSAYPSQMVNLPNFAGGWWEKVKEYDPEAETAIWAVSWEVGGIRSNKAWPLTPFPVRLENGEIIYPPKGRGFYWSPLVKVAKKFWGARIKVLTGYVFHPADAEDKPFSWLQDIYEKRQEYRKNGDGRHRVLKYGANAIYGKLAQGAGWDGRKPTFQSYIAAGLVTAGTQARLLEAALTNPREIISLTVDGIWTRGKLSVAPADNLGGWRMDEVAELFLHHPNVYAMKTQANSKWACHTSGFRKGEYPLDEALAGWDEIQWAWETTVPLKRFLGLGMALNGNRLAEWRRWVEMPVRLRLKPAAGYAGPEEEEWSFWEQGQVPKGQRPRAYVPKGQRVSLDYAAGQTLAMNMDQPDI